MKDSEVEVMQIIYKSFVRSCIVPAVPGPGVSTNQHFLLF